MNIIRYQNPEMTLWPQFDRLSQLREEVNRLLEGSAPTHSGSAGLFSGWNPTLDLSQDKDNVFVKVELPGFEKKDIDISLHEGVLTIAGERKQEKKVGEGEAFREERYFGRFHRSVTLPTEVDAAHVKATYRDGILEIELPKAEQAKPKQIEVNIS